MRNYINVFLLAPSGGVTTHFHGDNKHEKEAGVRDSQGNTQRRYKKDGGDMNSLNVSEVFTQLMSHADLAYPPYQHNEKNKQTLIYPPL